MTQVTGARLSFGGKGSTSFDKGGSLLPAGFSRLPLSKGNQQSRSYSTSSSYHSRTSGSGDRGAGFPSDLNSRLNFAKISWTGPIPMDAEETQEAGSSYKTYTWKVTDASGYTTTHWYTGPLGADRVPPSSECHSSTSDFPELITPEEPSPRHSIPSWTGPIPADATVTQAAGSDQKTYTWKVTDANGYTTTHWYSGPLGPDGAPARFPSLTDSISPGVVTQTQERRTYTNRVTGSSGHRPQSRMPETVHFNQQQQQHQHQQHQHQQHQHQQQQHQHQQSSIQTQTSSQRQQVIVSTVVG